MANDSTPTTTAAASSLSSSNKASHSNTTSTNPASTAATLTTATTNSPNKPTPAPPQQTTTTTSSNSNAKSSTSSTTTTTTNAPPTINNDSLSPSQLRSKLESTRKELRIQLEKKRKVDRELANLEASIYGFEGSYLSDNLFPGSTSGVAGATAGGGPAAHFGNIIKGYDAYLKAGPNASSTSASSLNSTHHKRSNKHLNNDPNKNEPKPGDRMFSMSSATYQKAVEMTGGVVLVVPGASASSLPTPTSAAATTATASGGNHSKKDKGHKLSGMGTGGNTSELEGDVGTPGSNATDGGETTGNKAGRKRRR